MSLISEALKKAQMDALRQDRLEQRFYMTHAGRAGEGENSHTYAIVISSFAGACVATAAALFYLTHAREPIRVPATSRPVVSAPAPVAAPSARTSPAPQPAAAVTQRVAPHNATGQRRTSPREERAASVAHAERHNDVMAPAEREQPRDTPVPALSRRQIRDGFREGATYASPVTGPLGAELTMTGISSLGGQFVAIINGGLVRGGSTVGPFAIEEIQARRVRVRYVDVSFWLTQ